LYEILNKKELRLREIQFESNFSAMSRFAEADERQSENYIYLKI